jgi:predicted peptidase
MINKLKEVIMYTKHKWESDVYYNFNYVVNLPKDYDENQSYPLVIFLHGAGEWGDDLDVACRHGYMKHVREKGAEYPFVFVAPQCPANRYWGRYTESLLAFLDDICKQYPIDLDRVYLTGLSMGGTGTWMLAMAAPERFAAIAPICGSGVYWFGYALKDVPVLAYHGDCDEVVPVMDSVQMVKSVNRHGGHAELRILHGVDHDAWNVAYEGDELYTWLLSHTRKTR